MNLRSDGRQNGRPQPDLPSQPTGEARQAGGEALALLRAGSDPESPAGTLRLMEEVCERENLKAALQRVKDNKGSPGVDGMTVNELPDYLKQHWPTIREQLLNGTYKPQPVRRVEIPKPDGGGSRKLGHSNGAGQIRPASGAAGPATALGSELSLIAASGSVRGGQLIRPWHAHSNTSCKATAGWSISIWKSFSIESTTTN